MSQQPTTSTVSRRTVAAGLAWSVPAIALAAAAPVQAISASQLTVPVQPYEYQTVFTRTPSFCNTTTNPQKGYIDTLCCTSPVSPRNGDCNQNPATSQGYWLESTSGKPGTASIDRITVTYTFNRNVAFDGVTYAQGTANTSGTSTWNSPDILGAGWTIVSKTARSISLMYTGSGAVDASTATNGTGFCTGYFINFRVTEGCYSTRVVTVTTDINMTYSDTVGIGRTWTKKTGPTGI